MLKETETDRTLMSSLEARVSGVEGRVDGLPDIVGSILASANREVSERVDGLDSGLASVAASAKSDVDAALVAMADTRALFGSQVTLVDSRAGAMESDLNAKLGSVRADLHRLSHDFASVSERVSRAENLLAAVGPRVDAATRELEEGVSGARSGLEERISAIREEVFKLREDARVSAEEAATDAARVRGRILSCEERLESLTADSGGSAQSLKDEIQGIRTELKDALRSVLRAAPEPKSPS